MEPRRSTMTNIEVLIVYLRYRTTTPTLTTPIYSTLKQISAIVGISLQKVHLICKQTVDKSIT